MAAFEAPKLTLYLHYSTHDEKSQALYHKIPNLFAIGREILMPMAKFLVVFLSFRLIVAAKAG